MRLTDGKSSLLNNLGQHAEAEAAFSEAIRVLRKLANEDPADARYRQELAYAHFDLAVLSRNLSRWPAAEEHFRQSLMVHEQLAAEQPQEPSHRAELATDLLELAKVFDATKRSADADPLCQRSLDIIEKLVADHPDRDSFRVSLAGLLAVLGNLRLLTGHTDRVERLAFSEDGKRIISIAADETLRTWDAASGQALTSYPVKFGGGVSGTAPAISPDGEWIVSVEANDGTLRRQDLATGKSVVLKGRHPGEIAAVAISSDGRWIVSGSDDSPLKTWDAAAGHEARTLQGHTQAVDHVAVSRDGRWIASSGIDATLRIWDATSGRNVRNLQGDSRIFVMAKARRDAGSPDAGGWAVTWCSGIPSTVAAVRRCTSTPLFW